MKDQVTTLRKPVWHHYVAVMMLGAAMFVAGGAYFSGFRGHLPARLWDERGASDEGLQRDVNLIVAYQESFLNVVQWGLGIVTAIAGAAIGFNLFVARDAYQRDLEALSKMVEAAAQAQSAEIARATVVLTRDVAALTERLDATSVKQQSELEAAKQSLARDVAEAKALTANMKGLQSQIETLRDELLWMKCETWGLQAAGYIGISAVTTYADLLEVAPKVVAGEMFIDDALDHLTRRVLPDMKQKGLRIDSGSSARLSAALQRLKPRYKIPADRVLALLAEVSV